MGRYLITGALVALSLGLQAAAAAPTPLVAALPPPDEAPPPRTCGADAMEPNDARGKARLLRGDTPARAVTCVSDADWFSLDLAAGERVRVVAVHPVGRRVVPKVFPPRRRKPVGERERGANHTDVRLQATRAGRYRVLVRTLMLEAVPYTLRIERGGGG